MSALVFCLRSGNFHVQDAHTGGTIATDDEKMKALVESNRRMVAREMAERSFTYQVKIGNETASENRKPHL